MTQRTITLQVVTEDMPEGVHGMSLPKNSKKDTDTYIVYINEDDTEDEQTIAFLHECLHVWHRDHYRAGANVSELEYERHEELKRLLQL